jgi:hypothetical protein
VVNIEDNINYLTLQKMLLIQLLILRPLKTDCGLLNTIEHFMELNMLIGLITQLKMLETIYGNLSSTTELKLLFFTNCIHQFKTIDI